MSREKEGWLNGAVLDDFHARAADVTIQPTDDVSGKHANQHCEFNHIKADSFMLEKANLHSISIGLSKKDKPAKTRRQKHLADVILVECEQNVKKVLLQ